MAAAFLAALAFLLPLWGGSPHTLDDARFDSLWMAAAVALSLLLAIARRETVRVPKGVWWILGGYACGLIALWLHGQNPAPLSAAAFAHSTTQGLLDRAPLAGALVLLALVGCLRSGKQQTVLLSSLAFGVTAAVWYGLAQSLGFRPDVFGPEDYAPPVLPFPGTNHAATVLSPVLIAALAWLSHRDFDKKTTRWIWLIFLLPTAFHLGQLGVLAARISLPLGLLWLIWQVSDKRKSLMLASAALITAMALGEGALSWRMSNFESSASSTARHSSEALRPEASTILGRIDMAEATLTHSLEKPLGIGLGRFEVDYPSWRGDYEAWTSSGFWNSPTFGRPKTPHNEIVLAIAENGFLGALFLGVGLVLLLRDKRRSRWATPALLALGVHAFAHAPLSDHSSALMLFAILLGLRTEPTNASASTLLPKLTLATLCLTALIPAWSQTRGEWFLSQRFAAIDIDSSGAATLDPQVSVDLLGRAAETRPGNPLTWALMATDFRETGQHETAARLWENTLLRNPYSMAARLGAFRAYLSLKQETAALLHLEAAELLEPRFRLVRDYRTQWLHGRASDLLTRNPPLFEEGLLFRAMAHARESDFDSARETLKTLSPFAEGHRAVIERVRLDADLDEALMRTLVLKMKPGWAPLLGPAWLGYRGFEPAMD